jgi:hypothetical protein
LNPSARWISTIDVPGCTLHRQGLQQIPPLVQGHKREVIQNEDVHPRQLPEEPDIRPIRPHQGERMEEAGHPPVNPEPSMVLTPMTIPSLYGFFR